jgi:hypothetical protein
VVLAVPDGSARCPDLANPARKPLPLCAARDSSQPGRWINSALPPAASSASLASTSSSTSSGATYCDTTSKRVLHFHRDRNQLSQSSHPGEYILNQKDKFKLSNHHYSGPEWFEASGDPCLVNSKTPEEDGHSHWFYAPYSCKYHFYNSMELHKCLIDQKLTHIHVAGDSMSRDLFSLISVYLGVSQSDHGEIAKLSTTLKEKNVQFHSGKVLLTEGFSWEYNPSVMKQVEVAPLPNIYITNYGFYHRNAPPAAFKSKWEETEYQYWTAQRPKNISMPEFSFFQNTRELLAKSKNGLSSKITLENSQYLAQNYSQLGFTLLDEHLLTSGRYDFYSAASDGWHFTGTKRQMEVVILFNMICNDWLKSLKYEVHSVA